MLTMDVFNQDAFSAISMTAALDKFDYVPGLLGSIPGLFEPVPVRTTSIMIEERTTGPVILPTSPRGAPPHQNGGDRRKVRSFETLRIADASAVYASELQGIRAFGSETELQSLAAELARRQFKIAQNFDLTFERWRLQCVQGSIYDKDNTLLYDWADEFDQTIPAEVDWDLDNADPVGGILRQRCTDARRSMMKGLKGMGGNNVRIVALCGDNFYDYLVRHPEIRDTYLGTSNAAWLREAKGWDSYEFGGITFINYRGTDDGSTLTVDSDKAVFFPVGAGIFQWAMSPGESFDFVNTPGQMFYSNLVRDTQRNMFVDVEVYSYPLPVCTMPAALYKARRT